MFMVHACVYVRRNLSLFIYAVLLLPYLGAINNFILCYGGLGLFLYNPSKEMWIRWNLPVTHNNWLYLPLVIRLIFMCITIRVKNLVFLQTDWMRKFSYCWMRYVPTHPIWLVCRIFHKDNFDMVMLLLLWK